MKRSRKIRRRLTQRIDDWSAIISVGMNSAVDKVVRGQDGKPRHSYRRPGSQSGRKH